MAKLNPCCVLETACYVLETPLAFASAPGSTVLTNLMDKETPTSCLTSEKIPEVYQISQDPLHYSIASTSAVQKIRELETIIAIDPGKRAFFP